MNRALQGSFVPATSLAGLREEQLHSEIRMLNSASRITLVKLAINGKLQRISSKTYA